MENTMVYIHYAFIKMLIFESFMILLPGNITYRMTYFLLFISTYPCTDNTYASYQLSKNICSNSSIASFLDGKNRKNMTRCNSYDTTNDINIKEINVD